MKEYPRKARLNVQLHRELAEMLREELADPRISGVTVTAVDVSPDLRNAKVLVSSLGDDVALNQAVDLLKQAGGRLRRGLGRRLRLRYVPQLRFVADKQLRAADRIQQLIHQAVDADRRHGGEDDS
ncbi:MAG: 30S ribosome-binding factor RbfA [Panacagrimonas sp.]